ncbi:2-C-methyl-D-erythritol 4-phosphate cytidylyltransferase [Propioniciclava soli]|uniref:2-C-methyl-D-erythritol 4-phosphate cytidylyltransferase n=1 Tax=Propioniciclava soli TaxID=2775081 RepID=A0ABZ3C8T8_9ACTN|nr:2-C-methyl-D-erythritol 4-phosphate cytidylyltransferase [Propioniciclava soli]
MGESPHTAAPVVAIVVAAGSGSRLGGEHPKALREVAGVPLVARSVHQLAAGGVGVCIVVVAAGTEDAFEAALGDAPVPCAIVAGGAERQHSVANGLALLDLHGGLAGAEVVLVHDAARAFVPPDVVVRVIAAVRAGADAVVPALPVADTIREVTDDGPSALVDRSSLRAVQTPQGFARAVLLDAHEALEESGTLVTDDAAAAEYLGHEVTLVAGAREAFKVTDPFDLVIAEALVARGQL